MAHICPVVEDEDVKTMKRRDAAARNEV